MDEFDKADRDDYLLDRAFDEDLRRDDWDELHEVHRGPPSLAELIRVQAMLKRRSALGTELILEEEMDG